MNKGYGNFVSFFSKPFKKANNIVYPKNQRQTRL
jgi:hypothetical protein